MLRETFTSNTPWRFVPNNFAFNDPANLFSEDFPESINVNYLSEDSQIDFVGIKVGDVSGNANPASFDDTDHRNDVAGTPVFETNEVDLEVGDTYSIHVRAKDFQDIAGFQFTLNYDAAFLKFEDLISGELRDLSA